jgi:hypothetical protein
MVQGVTQTSDRWGIGTDGERLDEVLLEFNANRLEAQEKSIAEVRRLLG